MRFIFTRRFYLLAALGLIPLALAWGRPAWRWGVLGYDVLLVLLAMLDAKLSRWPEGVTMRRDFAGRFAVGSENTVTVRVENRTPKPFVVQIKDEYPPTMLLEGVREARLELDGQEAGQLIYGLTPPQRGRYEFGQVAARYLSKLGLVWRQTQLLEPLAVKVYPNMRRARAAALQALGARSLVSQQRKAVWRGEGRDFESLRDYVRGDELRHLAWTATARRGKLMTRQYQIERDQNIIIALDAGRLMTARIGTESKLDAAVHAALALMTAAARTGDHAGLLVFGRHVEKYLPPKRGVEQLDAALETLHDVAPAMIEPSYTRAFEFLAANCKRRSLIVLLTDLVDADGSRELLTALKLVRPRHLPLVVTMADRDLKTVVREPPRDTRELFTQSVAEEIIYQRDAALRLVETQGGLALDVTAATLAPSLLASYLRIKERGLL